MQILIVGKCEQMQNNYNYSCNVIAKIFKTTKTIMPNTNKQ